MSRAFGNNAGRGLEWPTVDRSCVRSDRHRRGDRLPRRARRGGPPCRAGRSRRRSDRGGARRHPAGAGRRDRGCRNARRCRPRRPSLPLRRGARTTSYAWMTVAVAVLLVAMSTSRHVVSALPGTGLLFVPLYVFGGWAVLSMAWFGVSFAGLGTERSRLRRVRSPNSGYRGSGVSSRPCASDRTTGRDMHVSPCLRPVSRAAWPWVVSEASGTSSTNQVVCARWRGRGGMGCCPRPLRRPPPRTTGWPRVGS